MTHFRDVCSTRSPANKNSSKNLIPLFKINILRKIHKTVNKYVILPYRFKSILSLAFTQL